jgi:AcrR family transcriptional regulator
MYERSCYLSEMNAHEPAGAPQGRPRKRRSDGEKSRTAILDEATRLATIEGIGGLSIGRLAEAVGMSKSGLYAHFRSKEELQLAIVDTASELFAEQVVAPAEQAGTAIERLRILADRYLHYIEIDNFPGGCFFASVLAEVDMHPGAVRDRLVAFLGDWLDRLESGVHDAQAEGAIRADEDAAQLAFEIEAALFLANAQYVVVHTRAPLDRARTAIDRRLASATAIDA